jgi:glycine betaine/proline transport system ATP-binding protein
MQQRVGLARALALNPPILLMDEPFSGLDPLIRKEMQRELLRIQEHVRKTIVFITHDLDEAMTIGDRIAVLRDGRIEQLGSPQEIVLSPSSDYVSAFVRDVNFLKVLTVDSAMEPAAGVYRLGDHVPAAGGDSGVVLVTDADGRYLGILPFSRLADAAGAGPEALRRSLSAPPPPLHPEELLRNALGTVAQPPFLVPVTDAGGRLLGVVTRESVLAMLTRQRG